MEVLKKTPIELYPVNNVNNNAVFPIPGSCTDLEIFCKVKKFASRSFKERVAKSRLRLIYIYMPNEFYVLLVEIYYNGVTENDDKERFKKYFSHFKTDGKNR